MMTLTWVLLAFVFGGLIGMFGMGLFVACAKPMPQEFPGNGMVSLENCERGLDFPHETPAPVTSVEESPQARRLRHP